MPCHSAFSWMFIFREVAILDCFTCFCFVYSIAVICPLVLLGAGLRVNFLCLEPKGECFVVSLCSYSTLLLFWPLEWAVDNGFDGALFWCLDNECFEVCYYLCLSCVNLNGRKS